MLLRLALAAALTSLSLHALPITSFNTAVTENFDTLALTTSTVLPPGWAMAETGSGANGSYGAGTGSSATGNTYSFGLAGSSERALGTLRTASLASAFGTPIVNQTGSTVTEVGIQFTGEQWRLGAVSRPDRLAFSYSLDAASLTTGSWTNVTALDFLAPVTSAPTGALNGNAPANRATVGHTLTGMSVAAGSQFWIRWTDFDAIGSDDGLAIDDFGVTALRTILPAIPPTPPESVPDSLPVGLALATAATIGALVQAIQRQRKPSGWPNTLGAR